MGGGLVVVGGLVTGASDTAKTFQDLFFLQNELTESTPQPFEATRQH